ncbi:MAG: hypothetical protein ABWJ42_03580 [Sulfolobales archaeon]
MYSGRNRLKIARALVELNKSLVRLRILRERLIRRIYMSGGEERNLQTILRLVERYIAYMEVLSDRLSRLMERESLEELLEISRELKNINNEIKKIDSSISIGVSGAIELINEIIDRY